MLQGARNEWTENRAHARDAELHSDGGCPDFGVIGGGGEVVQDELRADNEKSGSRDAERIAVMIVDGDQDDDSGTAQGPPQRQQRPPVLFAISVRFVRSATPFDSGEYGVDG